MLLFLLVSFGLFLSGCSNGGGGDGDHLYAELRDPDRIKIYCENKITNSDINDAGTGFSVTVGGSSQSISNIWVYSPYDAVEVNLSSPVPGSGDIRVSYDGTGPLAGKLQSFTNLAVKR